jgi:hypothetical protein
VLDLAVFALPILAVADPQNAEADEFQPASGALATLMYGSAQTGGNRCAYFAAGAPEKEQPCLQESP